MRHVEFSFRKRLQIDKKTQQKHSTKRKRRSGKGKEGQDLKLIFLRTSKKLATDNG